MKNKWLLLTVFLLFFTLQGCETFQGAKEGFKKDWDDWNKKDSWVRENLW